MSCAADAVQPRSRPLNLSSPDATTPSRIDDPVADPVNERLQGSFPAGFLWGAATSAYQVEGSPRADGAGPSIWHRFSHTPGMVRGGDTGDVACDHYRRFADDVALMRDLGLTAYRFSISWSRVLPQGTGAVNQPGLDFYRRLVDALLEAGIRPSATLYHWDLPAALDDRGGWLHRDVAGWFADYAAVCVRALDGVALWSTLNEPWVVTDGGYLAGVLAPGRRSPFAAARAGHNLLRAHAAAVAAHRAESHAGDRGEIGVVVNLEPKHPASDSAADTAAAARADAYMNRHYLDPLLLGRYPAALAGIYGEAWEDDYDAEAAALAVPIDWLGINYYTRSVVRAADRTKTPGRPAPSASSSRTPPTPRPTGRSTRRGSKRSSATSPTTTLPRRSTSPRTAPPSTTRRPPLPSPTPPATSPTPSASPTSAPTSRPSAAPSPPAPTSAATSPGRCSTTSNGATASASASASSTSTSGPSAAPPRPAPATSPPSPAPTARPSTTECSQSVAPPTPPRPRSVPARADR